MNKILVASSMFFLCACSAPAVRPLVQQRVIALHEVVTDVRAPYLDRYACARGSLVAEQLLGSRADERYVLRCL